MQQEEIICPLCERKLVPPCNRHHLLPLSKGGRGTTTILLHKICHDKIHAVFTEMELKRYYHTIERIKHNEEISAFIDWVRKKESEYFDKSIRRKR
ncbi:MAG TPA: HNH endonuclease [Flavisolibacter sp.]